MFHLHSVLSEGREKDREIGRGLMPVGEFSFVPQAILITCHIVRFKSANRCGKEQWSMVGMTSSSPHNPLTFPQ